MRKAWEVPLPGVVHDTRIVRLEVHRAAKRATTVPKPERVTELMSNGERRIKSVSRLAPVVRDDHAGAGQVVRVTRAGAHADAEMKVAATAGGRPLAPGQVPGRRVGGSVVCTRSPTPVVPVGQGVGIR